MEIQSENKTVYHEPAVPYYGLLQIINAIDPKTGLWQETYITEEFEGDLTNQRTEAMKRALEIASNLFEEGPEKEHASYVSLDLNIKTIDEDSDGDDSITIFEYPITGDIDWNNQMELEVAYLKNYRNRLVASDYIDETIEDKK